MRVSYFNIVRSWVPLCGRLMSMYPDRQLLPLQLRAVHPDLLLLPAALHLAPHRGQHQVLQALRPRLPRRVLRAKVLRGRHRRPARRRRRLRQESEFDMCGAVCKCCVKFIQPG